jgi:hypothetical protein
VPPRRRLACRRAPRARLGTHARAAHRRLEPHRCRRRRAARQKKPRCEARLPVVRFLHGLRLALELSYLVNDRAPPGLGFPAWQVGKL